MPYQNKKEKIFTKIKFANALTPKEISNLNARYLHFGLNIKQIVVDSFGNEMYQEQFSIQDLLSKKRNRKDFNPLYGFLYKYYREEETNKCVKKYKKEEKYDKYSKEELLELNNDLNSLKEDCKKIEYKNCTIETDEFKSKIIDFILKYKRYITKEEYSYLFNKWKNELTKIRGVDIFNFHNLNNLYNWKAPILKAFKSEIILYAVSNICESKINGKRIVNENKNEENNSNSNLLEEEKKNDLPHSDSDSNENLDDLNFFNKNDGLFLKGLNQDEEF